MRSTHGVFEWLFNEYLLKNGFNLELLLLTWKWKRMLLKCVRTCSIFNWMTVVTNFICASIWNLCVYARTYESKLWSVWVFFVQKIQYHESDEKEEHWKVKQRVHNIIRYTCTLFARLLHSENIFWIDNAGVIWTNAYCAVVHFIELHRCRTYTHSSEHTKT